MKFDVSKLKKSSLHPDAQAKAMMDYIRRQKMSRVQRGMKKSFGHRTADVHNRDELIKTIVERLCSAKS